MSNIFVRRITNVEKDGNKQMVYLSGETSNLGRYLTADYMTFESGNLVFEIPAGMNVPDYVVRLGKLQPTQAVYLSDNRHLIQEDVLVNVRALFPVDPYAPNNKKISMKFLMDKSEFQGVSYDSLLDSFSIESSASEVEDDFELDYESEIDLTQTSFPALLFAHPYCATPSGEHVTEDFEDVDFDEEQFLLDELLQEANKEDAEKTVEYDYPAEGVIFNDLDEE
jgi:hypothetical protein